MEKSGKVQNNGSNGKKKKKTDFSRSQESNNHFRDQLQIYKIERLSEIQNFTLQMFCL